MTHGTSTLREVLEQHVTSVPEHPKRLEEVHRRARSLRRRRAGVAVGALAALVVVVLAVTAGPGLLTSRQDRSVPAYQQRVGALLVWNNGSRLAAHSSFLSTARRSATFTVTPTTWSMGVAQACSHELGQKLGVFLSVNGHVVIGGGCGPGGGDFSRGSYGIEQQFWAESGVHLGEPMTVRFWVAAMTKAPFRRGGSPPVWTGPMPATRVSLGVYDRVDPSAYPLPPRPRRLQPLDGGAAMAGGRVLWVLESRKVGADATGGTTVRLPAGGLTYDASFVAPGQLMVSVNGIVIDRVESWGYTGSSSGGVTITPKEMRSHGLQLRVGQRVTVTVTASRFADPGWRFQLRLPR